MKCIKSYDQQSQWSKISNTIKSILNGFLPHNSVNLVSYISDHVRKVHDHINDFKTSILGKINI